MVAKKKKINMHIYNEIKQTNKRESKEKAKSSWQEFISYYTKYYTKYTSYVVLTLYSLEYMSTGHRRKGRNVCWPRTACTLEKCKDKGIAVS